MTPLSVIIVNWNTKELLLGCLQSLMEQSHVQEYEIVVVDNASVDQSAQTIAQKYQGIKIIQNDHNIGFSKANNQGIRVSHGEILLFLNPDTLVPPGTLSAMLTCLNNQSDIGAVGCKLIYPDGRVQKTSARSFPTPLNQFFEFSMLRHLAPKNKFFGSAELSYWDHSGNREVECLSGACLVVKRRVLDEVGYFNERNFMYMDDIDLCYRIKKSGWKIFYLGKYHVVHYAASSSKKRKDPFFSSILIKDAVYRFMEIHYGQPSAFLYRVAVFLTSFERMFISGFIDLLKLILRLDIPVSGIEMIRKNFRTLKWAINMETWINDL